MTSAISTLLERHPQLPIVLFDVAYGLNRMLWPLMQRHRHLHLVLSPPYCTHDGIELLQENGSLERILFGTGYPDSDPAAAITYLMYSRISDDDKCRIGSGNLNRLLAEVKS